MKIPTTVTGRTRPVDQPLALVRDDGISARAMGALSMPIETGLGQSIANVGKALGSVFADVQKRQEAVQRTRATSDLMDFNTQLQIQLDEQRRATPFDEREYYERSSSFIDSEVETFIAKRVPPELQDEFRVRADEIRNRAKLDAYEWGVKQEDAFFSKSIEDAVTRATNGFMSGSWSRIEAEKHVEEIISGTDLPEIVKNDLRLQTQLKIATLDYSKAIEAEMRTSHIDAATLIRGFEDFRNDAYEDFNTSDGSSAGFRAGYGSDTVVRNDGTIERVTPETRISRADAERTLQYRIDHEFVPRIRGQVGVENWTQLPKAAKEGLISVAWNYGSLPSSVVDAVKTGDVQQIANAVESLSANPERRQKEAAFIRGAVGAYKRAEFENVNVYQDKRGYWYAPNLTYELGGKIRDAPVSADYVRTVAGTLRAIDPQLGAVVTSGGQTDDKRTGSTRHDVDHTGEAGTADIVLTVGGRKVTPQQNKELYLRVAEEMAAAGFTGIGHYSWGLHVGGGKRAAWGPSTTSEDLDPEFQAAINRGWQRSKDGVDGDPKFAMVPYEARIAARQDAETKINKEQAEAEKARKAAQEELMNGALTGIRDGSVTRSNVDDLIASGAIRDYDEMVKLDSALDKYQKDQMQAQEGMAKLNSPTGVFDPTSTEDKNMLNAVVGDPGKAALQAGDQEYFKNTIMPIVRRAQDIPTDVAGILQGMVRSNNPSRMGFAMDALSLLEQIAPDAYAMRVPQSVQSDVTFYRQRKDRMTQEDLMRQINGGLTPQERSARMQLRQEAQDLLRKSDYGMTGEQLTAEFDGWFSSAPAMVGEPWMNTGLARDYQTLFQDEYEKRGNADEAKAEALRQLHLQWGVHAIGGKKQLMKYPPHLVGYPEMSDGYGYIDREVRSTLGLTDDDTFVLISDDRTRQEAAAYAQNPEAPAPSYYVWTQNAEGVFAPAITEDGKPARMNFAPSVADKERQVEEFDLLDRMSEYRQRDEEFWRAMLHQQQTGTPVPDEIMQDKIARDADLKKLRYTEPWFFDQLKQLKDKAVERFGYNKRKADDRVSVLRNSVAEWLSQYRWFTPSEAPEIRSEAIPEGDVPVFGSGRISGTVGFGESP